jgi:predicted DsbA family dithiol-disulfide isomerase
VTHFPLHPDTPQEGRIRRVEPGRSMQMKSLFDEEGLPYNSQRTMTYNSRLAQEMAKWAESKGKGDGIHDLIFQAVFVEVKNIGKHEVLVDIARQLGLPTDEAEQVLLSRSFEEAVNQDWRRCAEIGVDAVPTFLAGRSMLVGARPYEELEKLILR